MPCVILSGGKGRRMGELKQNLPFLDSTLANFQAKRLKECFDAVYFSAKIPIDNAFGVRTLLDIIDEDAGGKDFTAPIFGVFSALSLLRCDVFVLSIDAPFFSCACAQKVVKSAIKDRSIFVRNTTIHPLLGIYRFNALDSIKMQIARKNYRLVDLLAAIHAQFITIPLEQTQNLNTQEDYKAALGVFDGR